MEGRSPVLVITYQQDFRRFLLPPQKVQKRTSDVGYRKTQYKSAGCSLHAHAEPQGLGVGPLITGVCLIGSRATAPYSKKHGSISKMDGRGTMVYVLSNGQKAPNGTTKMPQHAWLGMWHAAT